MDKIKVVPNDEFEALFPEFQPSQVTITLENGTAYTERVDVPKGDPRDPMTEDEISVKFNALGTSIVGEETCNALRSLTMNMEQEDTLDRLFQMMTEHVQA
jgi:2-methylcitrate dehydratase